MANFPHIIINFLWPPEPYENMLYLSPYHSTVLNSAKFCKNVEIPRKRANSVAQLKIPCSADKCGPSHIFEMAEMTSFREKPPAHHV